MPRRSYCVPVLAVAVCGLLASACSAPVMASTSGVGPARAVTSAVSPAGARTVGPQGMARAGTLIAGSPPALTAAAFPAPSSGWVLGQPGSGVARAEIWHTVTAGRTWRLLGRGTGLAWGQNPTRNPAVTVLSLFRTTDGGRSWRHSGTRLAWPPSGQATPLLDFSDANHGWLVLGGVTWRTADGGVTWTSG